MDPAPGLRLKTRGPALLFGVTVSPANRLCPPPQPVCTRQTLPPNRFSDRRLPPLQLRKPLWTICPSSASLPNPCGCETGEEGDLARGLGPGRDSQGGCQGGEAQGETPRHTPHYHWETLSAGCMCFGPPPDTQAQALASATKDIVQAQPTGPCTGCDRFLLRRGYAMYYRAHAKGAHY